jgi:uncharacterized protein (DUF924 family)
MAHDAAGVLAFWFAPESEPFWFDKDAGFDRRVREELGTLHGQASAGQLDRWQETPEGMLALVLLLDQVSRNLYRGDSRAFVHDATTATLVMHSLAHCLDTSLTPAQRYFFYMPLMHSEELGHQAMCCALMAKLGNREGLYFARLHHAVIERFGRFPHRNAVLGRSSTQEEAAYMDQGGLSF